MNERTNDSREQVVALCHSLAVFSRYLVCDADDAPRRRAAAGGFSYSALALPNLGQGLATVVAHWLIGMALGLFAWNFAAPRGGESKNSTSICCEPAASLYLGVHGSSAPITGSWLIAQALNSLFSRLRQIPNDYPPVLRPTYPPGLASPSPLAGEELAETSGAVGGLVAGGAACSAWSAVCFLRERRHHLRLGLPSGAAMPAYLRGEAFGSAKKGLLCGAVIGAGYL